MSEDDKCEKCGKSAVIIRGGKTLCPDCYKDDLKNPGKEE